MTFTKEFALKFGELANRLPNPYQAGLSIPVSEDMDVGEIADVLDGLDFLEDFRHVGARMYDERIIALENLDDKVRELGEQYVRGGSPIPQMPEAKKAFKLADFDLRTLRAHYGAEAVESGDLKKLRQDLWARRREYDGSLLESIGARLWGHDLVNTFGVMRTYIDLLKRKPERIDKSSMVDNYLDCLVNFKAIGMTVGYLASGGENALGFEIPTDQLQYLLKNAGKGKGEVNVDNSAPDTIDFATYTALFQYVKNAGSRGDVSSINVSARLRGGKAIYCVADDGPGLVMLDGEPLPHDSIKRVFGDYSSREGGGLGLQVAEAVAKLRGGSAQVDSKVEGQLIVSYNTSYGFTAPIGLDRASSTGCTFSIIVPYNT